MEMSELEKQTKSLSQLLFSSLELMESPNGPQIAGTVDSLFSELRRVIAQLQQDVAALQQRLPTP